MRLTKEKMLSLTNIWFDNRTYSPASESDVNALLASMSGKTLLGEVTINLPAGSYFSQKTIEGINTSGKGRLIINGQTSYAFCNMCYINGATIRKGTNANSALGSGTCNFTIVDTKTISLSGGVNFNGLVSAGQKILFYTRHEIGGSFGNSVAEYTVASVSSNTLVTVEDNSTTNMGNTGTAIVFLADRRYSWWSIKNSGVIEFNGVSMWSGFNGNLNVGDFQNKLEVNTHYQKPTVILKKCLVDSFKITKGKVVFPNDVCGLITGNNCRIGYDQSWGYDSVEASLFACYINTFANFLVSSRYAPCGMSRINLQYCSGFNATIAGYGRNTDIFMVQSTFFLWGAYGSIFLTTEVAAKATLQVCTLKHLGGTGQSASTAVSCNYQGQLYAFYMTVDSYPIGMMCSYAGSTYDEQSTFTNCATPRSHTVNGVLQNNGALMVWV